ncbi:hypothetical protein [Microbacterium caowuchunii]|uniref:Head-to-tail adaptor n=1 Tax=Microbacterium caowuchunii TaxID=2614638 RepID=A0A5N0TIP9_9MICO|nr:hypothetical protein [Microbacterium caowuchunii]KAA9133756.1 hypothetical protein F6B40_08375 [Microbacterium caowuchunii]
MPEESIPAFATADQMEQRSQGAITAESHPYLEDELRAASRAVRDYCRWHVAPARPVEYRRVGATADDVWLPATEVASIDAVELDGRALDAAELARVAWDPGTGWTNLYGRRVHVRYTAGYAEVPEAIVSLTLQVAARALGSPLGLVREQAGTVNVTHTQVGFNQAGGPLLLAAEQASLDAYRIGRLP